MHSLLHYLLLLYIITTAYGLENGRFETFILDVIDTWQLRSPTIIFQDEIPKMLLKDYWSIWVTDDMNVNGTIEDMHTIFKHGKQDGIIFGGDQFDGRLLKELDKVIQ